MRATATLKDGTTRTKVCSLVYGIFAINKITKGECLTHDEDQ